MINKIVFEFETTLEKEQPFIGFEDRRQITLVLKKILQNILYQYSFTYHIDGELFDSLSDDFKADLIEDARCSNVRLMAKALLSEGAGVEKFEKNVQLTCPENGNFREHQLRSTVYILKTDMT